MSINDINESAVICRFNFYLNKTAKIQETFEATLHDAINEEEELCGEELAYIIEAILIPEIAIKRPLACGPAGCTLFGSNRRRRRGTS